MITVVINTRNEESQIASCIESAKLLSQEVVVIDMESTDDTQNISRESEANVISFPFSQYVEPARSSAIKESQGDWVFILDADERITQELVDEISLIMNHNVTSPGTKAPDGQADISPTHYKIPRKNIFGKKRWLSHGGWWPDHQTRLIQKSAFVEWPARIHSTPKIKGVCGYLKNPILHYFHGDIKNMVEKTINFENIESDLLYNAKRQVSTTIFFRKFYGEMWRRLIKQAGFMDGSYGILESIYQAFSKTITYLLLYEKTYVKNEKPTGA